MAKCADDHNYPAHNLQHLHDHCLVWPFEISACAAVQSHPDQLAHRIRRILLSSASQSHWILRVHHGATEDNPGSDHANRVFDIFGFVFEGANPMELCGGLWNDGRSSCRDLQEMVRELACSEAKEVAALSNVVTS